jgi:hypothetical protein
MPVQARLKSFSKKNRSFEVIHAAFRIIRMGESMAFGEAGGIVEKNFTPNNQYAPAC